MRLLPIFKLRYAAVTTFWIKGDTEERISGVEVLLNT